MSDPLDDLLRGNARVTDDDLYSSPLVADMDALWLEAKVDANTPTAVRRRSTKLRRRITGAVAALVVVGVGAGGVPAFADWVSLHTSTYDTGLQSDPQPKAPDREWLRLDSPELAPQLRAWEQDYPLAPGYSLDPLIEPYAKIERSEATAGMMHDDVFFFSKCTWVDYWLTADRSGDAAGRKEATEGLVNTLAKLDSVVTLDQHGRVVLGELATAAQNDDQAPLKNEHEVNCNWNFR